jgi:predicted MFS family arabinose efflux permease
MNRSITALMLGNVVVGSGSLVIAGILNPISTDLGVPVSAAGQLNTAYALAYAISAPLVGMFMGAWCRTRLLMLGMALFGLTSVLGAFAPNYTVLLLSRVFTGIAAAMFSPNAAAVAAMLSEPAHRGRAIATVFGGFTLATAFGVPLGAYLGLQIGWRETLGVMGAASFVMVAIIAKLVPGNLQLSAVDLRGWLALAHDRRVLALLAVSLLQIAGTYAVFTFMGPFLTSTLKAGAEKVAALLMVFGAAGFVGNWVSGRMIDRVGAARIANINIAGVMAGMLILAFSHGSQALLIAGIIIWGGAVFSINTAQQTRLVQYAPALSGALLPANSSMLFAGQALGGLAGGLALSFTALGKNYTVLPWLGIAFAVIALVISGVMSKKVAANQ